MWIYFKFYNQTFKVFGEKQLLNSIEIFFRRCFDEIIYSNQQIKTDWTIITNASDKSETILDRDCSTIYFNYKKEHEFLELYGLLKETLTKLKLEEGWIWVHASAFEIKNTVFIIVGPKGAGKTTWLLYAAKYMDAKIIGNDQIPIYHDGRNLYTRIWRSDVKSTINTLKVIKECNSFYKETSNVRVMIFPSEDYDRSFDYYGMKELTGQILIPQMEICKTQFHFVDKIEHKISKVVFLYDDRSCLSDFSGVINDSEVLLPTKAANWEQNYKYWNKRFTKMHIPEKAIESEKRILDLMQNSRTVRYVYNQRCLEQIKEVIKENI